MPGPSRAEVVRPAGGRQPARRRERLIKDQITDSLVLLLGVVLVGIPVLMMMPDKAVTWPDLALTLLCASVLYALRRLGLAVITLFRSRRSPDQPQTGGP